MIDAEVPAALLPAPLPLRSLAAAALVALLLALSAGVDVPPARPNQPHPLDAVSAAACCWS